MFSPQRRGWPGRSFVPSTEKKDKGKVLSPEIRTPGSNEGSTMKNLIEPPPPVTFLDDNRAAIVRSEPEIWKRFREAGTLDEDSIEKKDRAALIAHISSIEAELYDYQYNMGLLLMERKEWDAKTEKLKAALQESDENLKRELSAHLIAISESEKREEAQKKALAVEKQCVADVSWQNFAFILHFPVRFLAFLMISFLVAVIRKRLHSPLFDVFGTAPEFILIYYSTDLWMWELLS
eukprot:c28683_g1_i1 orf=528-1235(+)